MSKNAQKFYGLLWSENDEVNHSNQPMGLCSP